MKTIPFILVAVLLFALALTRASVAQEFCEEGERRICGTDKGVCEPGRSVCEGGVWTACEGGKGPESYGDVCGDGLDNDCDGEVDENCVPWVSFILVGAGFLLIGIGLWYMQKGESGRMSSEGLSKD